MTGRARRVPALVAATLALIYFASGLSAREPSLLESQDLGYAAELFRGFRLSADHSPLHFAFLNLWLHAAGASLALVRLPSALFVAAATGVVYRLAERVSGTTTARWAALLFAVNPEVVDQARSLRLYGLGILFAAICLERAHAFARDGGGVRAWVGFLAAAALAVQTHLFLWLWVAPLLALVGLHAWRTLEGMARRRAFIAAAIAGAVMLPQVVHGYVALGFTHERHAVYGGVSHGAVRFLDEIGRHLLLGETPEVMPVSGYVLALVAVLPALGAAGLERGIRRAVLLASGLPFLATFALSFGSEVEARYLCFALPGLAVLGALGIIELPRALGEGAALALAAISMLATARAYGAPASDWPSAAARLTEASQPDDVVAVFPGYWAETFRFYAPERELVPITYPADLEHALARGHRVLLVENGGRYRGNLDAYLDATTTHAPLFTTNVRDTFTVEEVRWTAPRASVPQRTPATVVFAGLVGSGGYDFGNRRRTVRAFDDLYALFASAELAVTGYAPCEPPWPARLLLGPELSEQLLPNRTLTDALHAVGVRAVVVSSTLGAAETAAPSSKPRAS